MQFENTLDSIKNIVATRHFNWSEVAGAFWDGRRRHYDLRFTIYDFGLTIND
jgi:hypothetical protein